MITHSHLLQLFSIEPLLNDRIAGAGRPAALPGQASGDFPQ